MLVVKTNNLLSKKKETKVQGQVKKKATASEDLLVVLQELNKSEEMQQRALRFPNNNTLSERTEINQRLPKTIITTEAIIVNHQQDIFHQCVEAKTQKG
jgi:hypothetical protein